jgi:hypothetical protein
MIIQCACRRTIQGIDFAKRQLPKPIQATRHALHPDHTVSHYHTALRHCPVRQCSGHPAHHVTRYTTPQIRLLISDTRHGNSFPTAFSSAIHLGLLYATANTPPGSSASSATAHTQPGGLDNCETGERSEQLEHPQPFANLGSLAVRASVQTGSASPRSDTSPSAPFVWHRSFSSQSGPPDAGCPRAASSGQPLGDAALLRAEPASHTVLAGWGQFREAKRPAGSPMYLSEEIRRLLEPRPRAFAAHVRHAGDGSRPFPAYPASAHGLMRGPSGS